MATSSHYHVRRLDRPHQFVCVKLDGDMGIVDAYYLEEADGAVSCDCHAGSWDRPCRHLAVLQAFRETAQIGRPVVYRFDDGAFLSGSDPDVAPAPVALVPAAIVPPAPASVWDFLVAPARGALREAA